MAIPNSASLTMSEEVTLDFSLFHISEKESSKMIFDEHLKLVNSSGAVVDEVTITVEPSNQPEGGFVVFQHSQDESLMLRTNSHVTPNLETISEVRKIKMNDTTKMLRIMNLPDMYRLFMVETDVEQWAGTRDTREWSKKEHEPLVLEGANVLLLRKMAMSWHFGKLTALTVDNDGVLSEARYLVEFHSQGEVQVTRVVGSETMTTVLNNQGRILRHKWSNSQWRLESNLPRVKSRASSEADNWDQVGLQGEESEPEPLVDMPAYWEKKEEVLAQLSEYMTTHSCVQDMIADLIKNILFERPQDPVDFADKFFSEFLGIVRDSDTVTEEVEKAESICSKSIKYSCEDQ